MITRRHAIKTTTLATLTAAAAPHVLGQSPASKTTAEPFTLPPLPYAYDALEPHIDARTMEIHHDKHHAGYVANLNKAIAATPALANKSLEELVTNPDATTAIRNNGGGHYNHSLFWQMMAKKGGGTPRTEVAKAIESSFGDFAEFKNQFSTAATKVFGSGWAWLTWQDGKLSIQSRANQDVPLSKGSIPLLGIDVWEHAYYLNYQNKRADYVAAWWKVVNWDFVAERFQKAKD